MQTFTFKFCDVTDGIQTTSGKNTRTWNLAGSVSFMSPELYDNVNIFKLILSSLNSIIRLDIILSNQIYSHLLYCGYTQALFLGFLVYIILKIFVLSQTRIELTEI